ncbi:DUF2252 family protein [Pseudoduganella sp. LjRoot289]|uniref:DUF2252 domain-containing protein n=1 Tax=Pseudoduganella sp. LjRoot289 TaxID=3342314 RepID=UPI003ECCE405
MSVAERIFEHNHRFRAADNTDLDLKMTEMRKHVFPFYRATAHLFYPDMAMLPPSRYTNEHTARTWLAGDAHLANFCAMRDAGGTEVFAVCDFDEGYPGPYVWDVRRLAVSLLLADYGTDVPPAQRNEAVAAMAGAYLERMAAFKGNDSELRFQLTADNTRGIVRKTIQKAASADRADFLRKCMEKKTGPVSSGTRAAVLAAMPEYVRSIAPPKRKPDRYYKVLDVRQRFGAGMGSLGKLRYYALLEGPTGAQQENVILELKQAIPSSVALAGGDALPPSFYGGHEGHRIARAQKALQLNADPLTGYTSIAGLHFHVHEKAPTDKDFKPEDIDTPDELNTAAAFLGMALAAAHARADEDYDDTVVSISIDKRITEAVTSRAGFSTELTDFANDYAARVRLDWQAFSAALDQGVPMY